MDILLLVVFAYLLGSVPIGFLLGSLSGLDIRRAGSGNIGATNVARVVGKRQGLVTLLGDVAKGFIPAFLSLQMGYNLPVTGLIALAAFVGHLYPVFLRFRGGKGVATAFGVFLGLAPMAALVLGAVFLIVALVSRLVSLASLVAASLAPVVFWLFSYPLLLVGLSLFISLWIILRHRENIQRLRSGAEPKFNL
jgi:glycerol-3-phosphate acyltransferase PlsY